MRQRISTRISVLTACIAGVLSVACIGPAAADLLPHRAVYTLSIGAGSAMSGGAGEMRFEVKDVCDGWASDLKVDGELIPVSDSGRGRRLSSPRLESGHLGSQGWFPLPLFHARAGE